MSLMNFIRRKKQTDSRIIAGNQELTNVISNALANGRYSILEFDVVKEVMRKCIELNDYEKYEYFYDLFLEWDSDCNLDRSTGEMINEKMNSKDSTLATHRTYVGPVEDIDGLPYNLNLQEIMETGLINNGHSMQGAYTETPSLRLTTTAIKGLGDLINVICSYKENNVTILLEFPRDIVDENLNFIDKSIEANFYNKEYGSPRINPSYILGVIVKNDNGLDRYFNREELLSKSVNL